MTPRIIEKIVHASRALRQEAEQAIRKDIIRALVELITNSDDSYRDLEKAGHNHSGKIIIDVATIDKKKRIRIRDEAEGMSLEKLINVLKEYGGTQSSSYSEEGAINRGLFGRGLKDSIIGLGDAKIVSFHAGYFSVVNVNLMKDDFYAVADSDMPQRVNRKMLQEYNIPFKTQGGLDPHGTIIDLKLNKDIPMPRFDTILKSLSTHFQLRYIMQNPKRNIHLRDFRKKQKEIKYHPPDGKTVFDKNIKTEKTKTNIELEIRRSRIALDAPVDNHPYSHGGLIITTHGIALENTLFGHGKGSFANHFFGKAEIPKIFDFLIKDKYDTSILKTSRDGINWDHSFMKPIKDVILKELKKCIKDYEEEVKKYEKKEMPKELQMKNNKALNELNKIAKQELDNLSDGTLTSDEKETNKRVFCPSEGYGFVPDFAITDYGNEKSIYFRAKIPEIAKAGDTVHFSSNSEYVEIIDEKLKLEPHKDDSTIGQTVLSVKGMKIGEIAEIEARLGDYSAVALIEVRTKQDKKTPTKSKKKRKGLFKDIQFDENAHPDQRVVITDDGILKIALKSDTVRLYFGEAGKPKKENSSLTFLAEIICEAMCNKIAALKYQRGDLLIISGDLSFETMQYHQNVLESKYSHLIHKIYCSNEITKNKNTKMVQSI